MLRIGLTGGIGSGKSTAAKLFAQHEIKVIDADVISHALSQQGQPAYDQIVQHFGEQAVMNDGELDRRWLRERVFSDPADKQALENILHPAVRSTMEIQLTAVESPYCVLVVPLLIETGFSDMVDRILVVLASEANRIERVRKRSDLSEQQVRNIINTQATVAERLEVAHDVVTNDGPLHALQGQVSALDRKYRGLAG
jgi:dephospho-CoA kinase